MQVLLLSMYEPWWGKTAEKDEEGGSQEHIVVESNSTLDTSQKENYVTHGNDILEFDLSDDDCTSDEGSKFFQIMAFNYKQGQGPNLPNNFQLNNPYPGEPFFMKLRQKPAVLRFHKFKQEKDADAFWFSEAILYIPHENEEHLNNQINSAKETTETWKNFSDRINFVKSQVMENLAENELARLMAEDIIIDNDTTGENLNPEVEQELEDNRLEVYEQLPAFEHLDPDAIEARPKKDIREKSFKAIEVRPLNILKESAAQLDYYQKRILDIRQDLIEIQ